MKSEDDPDLGSGPGTLAEAIELEKQAETRAVGLSEDELAAQAMCFHLGRRVLGLGDVFVPINRML